MFSSSSMSSTLVPRRSPLAVPAGSPGPTVTVLPSSQDLPEFFHETQVQLLRTHAGMRQLVQRCEGVGAAMERCAAAVAALPSSGNSSFSAAAAPAAPSSPYRQLYWSLSQFHTHAAQLLSAASLQAYDAAVADKMARRLALMERGAETFHRGVAAAQRQATDAAVRGSARQLEQLASTRFAPAYEGFLLYTVATLGDVCALWATAAQRSAEEVVWSSGQAAQSPPAAPLHAEQASAAEAKARGRGPRRSSATTLSAAFGAAVQAVEELRDALFTYVRLLHGTLQQFALAASALSSVLRAVLDDPLSEPLEVCFANVACLSAALDNAKGTIATRRGCYEAMVEDGVLRPLRQLQEDSRKGLRMDRLVDAVNYPLMEKTSTVVELALRRLTESRSGGSKDGASHRPSRSNSSVEPPSTSMEVLFLAWVKTADVCLKVGTDVSNAFTERLEM